MELKKDLKLLDEEKSNKDLIQSYLLTSAHYDFSVYEKRILFYLVKLAQCKVEGLKFPQDCVKIKHDLWGHPTITMPISFALAGEDDKNHKKVKDALISLSQKGIEYEDNKAWQRFNIVFYTKIDKYEHTFSFSVHEKIWDCILDFSKGFTKYELNIALKLKRAYSMRFYELVSNQKRSITYSVEQLRKMFKLEDKYERIDSFIRRVIKPSKEELDRVANYTFDYIPNKVGKSIVSFTFIPIEQPEKRDQDLVKKELDKKVQLHWDIPNNVRRYLLQSMEFTTDEIKRNRDTFKAFLLISKDPMYDLALLKSKSRNKENPKGWVINSLKGKIKDYNAKRKF